MNSKIYVQKGLPRLADLGVVRHEYAHLVLERLSLGLTKFTYHNSAILKVAEEFTVHAYGTGSFYKAFIFTFDINRSYMSRRFFIESGIVGTGFGAIATYWWYR
jgi:hypothetical protein